MQKVYESSTALEAHMVKNLLETEDIPSRVDGEDLQGGVGTLQAIGIVRVLVDEANFKRARDIIDKWESDQPRVRESKSKPKSSAAKGFFIGALVAASFTYWIFSSPVTTDGIDYNGDGSLDEKWIYKSNRISKATYDKNLDGVVDQVYNYSVSGIIKSAELDNDFDGTFETKIYLGLSGFPKEFSYKKARSALPLLFKNLVVAPQALKPAAPLSRRSVGKG